jgi:signal peptidase I
VTYNPNELENENGKKGEKQPKSKLRETIDFFIPIVIAIVIAMILKMFVFANAVVPTGSMLNTIQEGDRIIASRLAYISNDPERYDIVIFHYPDDEEQYFVKRVIGLPGETVEIVDGIVYVTTTDGETIQLDDSFVTNCTPTGDFGPYVVPEDSYFMMGDNRNSSWDSRYWDNKFVQKDKIIGKVKFRYYPSISKVE